VALKGEKAERAVSRLLSLDEVCRYLGVSPTFVYRHAKELGAYKVGSKLRFSVSNIEAWLEKRRLSEESWRSLWERDFHKNEDRNES
jgi:excisionase family DNA binding protein